MTDTADQFRQTFYGYFSGIKTWDDLAAFSDQLKEVADDNWYVYETSSAVPTRTISRSSFIEFINEADRYLHEHHDEDYCGIVYVDNLENPAFIKIYDPNNLGVVCGFSDNPPLPKWSVSRLQPADLNATTKKPQRGWKKWLGNFLTTAQ
jgi:hypothetical protein